MDIRVDASELKDLGELLRRAPDALRADLETDVMETSAYTQGIAREGAPIFHGTLVNGIHVSPVAVIDAGAGISVTGGVNATAPHSVIMEDGRRPGATRPPFQPILRWVELKVRRGDLSLPGDSQSIKSHRRSARKNEDSAIRSLAFVIQRSIGRKGIVGRKFMAKAATAAQDFLTRRVEATTQRWVDRLGGGR